MAHGDISMMFLISGDPGMVVTSWKRDNFYKEILLIILDSQDYNTLVLFSLVCLQILTSIHARILTTRTTPTHRYITTLSHRCIYIHESGIYQCVY